jgi:hypothetical protein
MPSAIATRCPYCWKGCSTVGSGMTRHLKQCKEAQKAVQRYKSRFAPSLSDLQSESSFVSFSPPSSQPDHDHDHDLSDAPDPETIDEWKFCPDPRTVRLEGMEIDTVGDEETVDQEMKEAQQAHPNASSAPPRLTEDARSRCSAIKAKEHRSLKHLKAGEPVARLKFPDCLSRAYFAHCPFPEPFANRHDYELGRWFAETECTLGDIDEYLKNEIINPKGVTGFQNADMLMPLFQSIPYGIPDDQWYTYTFDSLTDKGMYRSCDRLFHRDIMNVIRFMIRHPGFRKNLSYSPMRYVIRHNDGKKMRVYNEFNSGRWWQRIQKKLPENATVIPLILATDKTILTQHRGDRTLWPVYLTIGNLDAKTRRSEKSPGMIPIGIIPTPYVGNDRAAKFDIYHKAMAIILKREAKPLFHDELVKLTNFYYPSDREVC